MKRRLLVSLLTLAALSLSTLSLVGCSGVTDENSAVQRAFRSAIAPETTESAEDAAQLSSEEALSLVSAKLDPDENYTADVTPAPVTIESKPYYIVTVSLDSGVLEPAAAVDPLTGDLYSCYDGKVITDFSEFPFVAQNQKAADWNGDYQNDAETAKVSLLQSDSQCFEFTLEATASGITNKLNGIATIQGNLAHYEGEDGMSLVFLLDENVLTIYVPANNTAAGADGYAGEYTLLA